MYAKILIKGKMKTKTGLHIGTGGEYSAIGAADSPVVRDAYENLPMVPASSLKGKMRTLLAKQYCPMSKNPSQDDDAIQSLFGSTSKPGKLIFNDLFLNKECMEDLRSMGIYNTTEVKFENTINRLSSVANPRQIERVIRGCDFDLDMIYNMEAESEAKVIPDFKLLADGFRLLQYDYLGGSGSRGYGKIAFSDLTAECVVGTVENSILEECCKILKGVESI